ncbi:MAG: DUF6691 family protein [Rhodospirillaceae bacterium]
MRPIIVGLSSGLLFGFGLALSGMTDPLVVTGFLDLAGAWNPALAFVMAGALTVTAVGYRVIFKRGRPLWTDSFTLPTRTAIDARLILGAVLFGIGWGLSGYCPGPALASLSAATPGVAAFVTAMIIGLGIVRSQRS